MPFLRPNALTRRSALITVLTVAATVAAVLAVTRALHLPAELSDGGSHVEPQTSPDPSDPIEVGPSSTDTSEVVDVAEARQRFLALTELDDDEVVIATIERLEAAAEAAALAVGADEDSAGGSPPDNGSGGTGGASRAPSSAPRPPAGGRSDPAFDAAVEACTQQVRTDEFYTEVHDPGADRWVESARGFQSFRALPDFEGIAAFEAALSACLDARVPGSAPRARPAAEIRAEFGPDPFEVYRDCEAEFPVAAPAPTSWPEARDSYDFEAAYAQDLANHRCVERRLPGESRPPMTPEESRRIRRELHERFEDAARVAEARADAHNPSVIADAIARIRAGERTLEVALIGDTSRKIEDLKRIGEACDYGYSYSIRDGRTTLHCSGPPAG